MSVLGRQQILGRFGEIFVSDGAPENARAAKYWLRLSTEYLVLPDGTRWTPDKTRNKSFVIYPGESAFVSTRERIVMPADLIGIIGPRYTNAEHGVLFFGGMLVDPGYGLQQENGEPLYFNIANIGSKPFELRPGDDEIASLALLEVGTPPTREELTGGLAVVTPSLIRDDLFRPGAEERPSGALGLVEDVNDLRRDVEKLETSLHQVVLFGVVVLAITLLAAIVSALVSLDGSGSEAGVLWPSDPLWKSAGLTVAVLIGGTAALTLLIYAIAALTLRLRTMKNTVRLRS